MTGSRTLYNRNNIIIVCFSTGDFPKCVKQSCVHALLMMMTCTEILSKNKLLEYIVTSSSLLESIFLLLSQTDTRIDFGHDCLIMLVLLVNFEKDRPNDCAVRLSLLDDHLTLNGYSQVTICHTPYIFGLDIFTDFWDVQILCFQSITAGLSEFCMQNFVSSENNSGWFHSITSMVGSMFVTDENSKNESLW